MLSLHLEIVDWSGAKLTRGANLENENPGVLLQSALRFFQFLPSEERKVFLDSVTEQAA